MTFGYRAFNENGYFKKISSISDSFLDNIPDFDRKLDLFFSQNAEVIVDEWKLVTNDDLNNLRSKLDYLSYEVNRLTVEKDSFEKRVQLLRATLDQLERH